MVPVGYAIGVMVMMAVLTAALAIIGYFIRDLKKSMIGKDEEHDRRLDALREKFEDFRAKMPEVYILREDWVRATLGFDAKFNEINKQLTSISREVSKLIAKGEKQ